MADPRVSQIPVEIVQTEGEPSTSISQIPVEMLTHGAATVRGSQLPVELLIRTEPPPIHTSQMCVEIISRNIGSFVNIFVNV